MIGASLFLATLLTAPSASLPFRGPLTGARAGLDGGAADDTPAPGTFVPEGFCVVMPEEPVDPNVTAEWNGRTVSFCCKMCRKEFLADPEVYAALLPPLSPPQEAAVSPGVDGGSTQSRPLESPPNAAAASSETEPANDPSRPDSWLAWAGRFHPLVVHFPLALLAVAGAAELLTRRGDPRWRARARFCLSIGAPTAALAAGLGWIAALESSYPTMQEELFRHRWAGITSASLALLALVLAPSTPTGARRDRLYRVLLFAAVLIVAFTGHQGGTLVFGPDHLNLPG